MSLTILPADTAQDDSLYLILSEEERRDLINALDYVMNGAIEGGWSVRASIRLAELRRRLEQAA